MQKNYEIRYKKLPGSIKCMTVKYLETGETIIYINKDFKEKGEMK